MEVQGGDGHLAAGTCLHATAPEHTTVDCGGIERPSPEVNKQQWGATGKMWAPEVAFLEGSREEKDILVLFLTPLPRGGKVNGRRWGFGMQNSQPSASGRSPPAMRAGTVVSH